MTAAPRHAVISPDLSVGFSLAMSVTVPPLPLLTSLAHDLDLSPDAFGWFRDSRPLLEKPAELHDRFSADGYLFLAGVLDPEAVDRARLRLLEQLHELGLLQPGTPVADGIAR